MKKYIYLLIAPTLFALASCGNNMPSRKGGDSCNVTFTSTIVTSDAPETTPMDKDLVIHLNVPYVVDEDATWEKEPTATEEGVLDHPNIDYVVNVDDIHVSIDGKEYPDSFTFTQINTGYNILTIRKEYVVNDIDIKVNAQPREFLYLYGYELGEEIKSRRYKAGETPTEGKDLLVEFKRSYQNVEKPIKTLDGQEAYPVFERDEIDVTFTLNPAPYSDNPTLQPPLPDDICYRHNARYGQEGIDFIREYSEPYYDGDEKLIGYRKCHIVVPFRIVDDHGSFRQYGTE